MKRIVLVLLAVSLMLPLMNALAAPSPSISPLLLAHAKGGMEAVWEMVTPKYGIQCIERDKAILTMRTTEPMLFATEVEKGVPILPQNYLRLQIQETNGVGFTIEQINEFQYRPETNKLIQKINTMPEQPYLSPYGTYTIGFGGPRSGGFTYRIYEVMGRDDFDNQLSFYCVVTVNNIFPPDTQANDDYDTQNLRLNADFELEVAENVWWVPVSSLGGTRYTNGQVAANINDQPEEKQQTYATLYEALQLYQVGNFYEGNDNQRTLENGINWEQHKPGYHAVRTNTGCCATDSNWLNYILKGDYEEVGFMAYSQSDGSGHIFNYIRHEGHYYFIDLTHYRTDFLDSSAVESGILSDYHNSDFIAGNLHKAASPEDYVAYINKSFNDPPELFFIYQAEDCLPVDGVQGDNGITITYADEADIRVVYDDPADQLYFAKVPGPVNRGEWESIPDAVFEVEDAYQSTQDAEPFGLDVKVGEKLTLTEGGESNSAIIFAGDMPFTAAITQNFWVSFEAGRPIMGGKNSGYVSLEISLEQLKDVPDDMETVFLGDFMLDFSGLVDRVQIVRCREENGELVVTEIINQARSQTERVFLERNQEGAWQSIEPQWFLISYEANGIYYQEYARYAIPVVPN